MNRTDKEVRFFRSCSPEMNKNENEVTKISQNFILNNGLRFRFFDHRLGL